MPLADLKREDFLYQPFYCEENIWHICQNQLFDSSEVIFIASTGGSFPMLNQRVSNSSAIPVLWDYHVVLLFHAQENQIIDFDTALPFSCESKQYFSHSFLDNRLLESHEQPLFRIVSGSDYIAKFSSDRSHMKTKAGWLAPPPVWPPIGELPSNLADFIDMSNRAIGEVLTLDEVLAMMDA